MDKLGQGDPQRIGAYRLLARLGAGGMGHVYLARSDRGRTVAVKLVREELAEQEEFRGRFRQEVQAARRVGGQWTAPVLDADTEAAVPWVATGYVAGPTLQTVVGHDHGALPERSVRILTAGLAHALKDIHAAGLIHRDLKPSNVMVTIDGPRVIDFGIARALETVTDGGLTRTGALVGSPGFMSPEQVRGDRITPACDVFCLGSVLAYAASGALPFGAANSSVHALMFRIAQEEPDLSALPESLTDLVHDCLRKEPGDRPSLDDILERTGAEDTVHDGRSREPWLPGALVAQLGRHAVQLLDTEDPHGPDAADGAGSGGGSGTGAGAVGAVGGVVAVGTDGDVGPAGAPSRGSAGSADSAVAGGGAGANSPAGAGGSAVGATPAAAAAGDAEGAGGSNGPAGAGGSAADSPGFADAAGAAGAAGPGTAGPGAASASNAASGDAGAQPASPDPAASPPAPGSPGQAQLGHLPTMASGQIPPPDLPSPPAPSASPAPPGSPGGYPGDQAGPGGQPDYGYPPAAGQHSPGYGYPQPGPHGHTPPYGAGATPPPYGHAPSGAPSPYGTAPAHPYGPPPQRRSGRSTAALVAVAVVVALGAGGSVYALMQDGHGGKDDDAGKKPGTSAPATPGSSAGGSAKDGTSGSGGDNSQSPAGNEGTVPTPFLGTWDSGIDTASGHSSRHLVVQQGEIGDTVLTLTADGPSDDGGSYHCVFHGALESDPGSDGPVRIGPTSVAVGKPATSCSAGAATTLTMLSDGTLRRVNDGNGDALVYTKSD